LDLEASDVGQQGEAAPSNESSQAPVSTAPDVAAPEKAEVAPAARVALHIRKESRAERLVDPAIFAEEPFSLSEEELSQVWAEFMTDEQYSDIVRTADEHSGKEYLHSQYMLSVAYAKLLLRQQANDPKYLIAEVVRENSEKWPRPIAASFFSETEIFSMTAAEVTKVLTEIAADEAYSDIQSVITSNGAVYLYSDRFMVQPVAERMAQWVEVDSHDMYNQ
jgi:hypothetical protein